MTNEEVKVVIGGMLHDIGKVIYRQGDNRRKHSQSGYEFLKDEVKLQDKDILDAVRYHHGDALRNAAIDKDSMAYIVYIADNIASAADRRQKDTEDVGFEESMPLQTVFNILNGNHQGKYYEPKTLDIEDGVNYPKDEKKTFDKSFYTKVKMNLMSNLKGLKWSKEYVNSLLEVMEANLSYIPSSTAKHEMADISLYDHVKLTAAVSGCIYGYLKENQVTNYREILFEKSKTFYEKKVFLLYSMDISGIQDFIYTITSKHALKTLRARSFYLEIMMEHIMDCLLEELHLSRTNIIYSGGGHCYILLPNTEKTKQIIEQYNNKLNAWIRKTFKTALYVADGYAECSTNDLKNVPNGSYAEVFRNIGDAISQQKNRRYTATEIIQLNTEQRLDYTRECKVCKCIGLVNDEDVCPICSAIQDFSKNILYDDFFTISLNKKENGLPLPGDYYLYADNEESLRKRIKKDNYFVRAYSKNKMMTGQQISSKLWVGDYTSGKSFKELAVEADGIERIGILRADVDNLGQAFVSGFENEENQNRYVTLSRTATLSRQLSLFFKFHINQILRMGEYNATICYSGGDDLFIVGSWNDIIDLAIDMEESFEKYTQGMLTLSAGIGIYTSGYPISVIAEEVADMESEAKGLPGKAAVTLFGKTYHWKEFKEEVLGEKYKELARFFDASDDRGKNFLYHLHELISNRQEKINFARYVYILSRLEPDEKADARQKENYKVFSKNMYQWIQNEKDCIQLQTAIIYYVYLHRVKEE